MWKSAECAIRKGSFQSMIYCILLNIGKFLSSPPLQDTSVQLQNYQSVPPGMCATIRLNGWTWGLCLILAHTWRFGGLYSLNHNCLWKRIMLMKPEQEIWKERGPIRPRKENNGLAYLLSLPVRPAPPIQCLPQAGGILQTQITSFGSSTLQPRPVLCLPLRSWPHQLTPISWHRAPTRFWSFAYLAHHSLFIFGFCLLIIV